MNRNLNRLFLVGVATASTGLLSGCNNEVVGVTTKPCTIAAGLPARDTASTSSTGYLLPNAEPIPPGTKLIAPDFNSERIGFDEHWQKQPIDSWLVLPNSRRVVSNLGGRFDGPCGVKYGITSLPDATTVTPVSTIIHPETPKPPVPYVTKTPETPRQPTPAPAPRRR